MKKLITIIILAISFQAISQPYSLVVRNDTVFGFNPLIGVLTQYTKLIPPMEGQSGKVLSNNGTIYQWADAGAGSIPTDSSVSINNRILSRVPVTTTVNGQELSGNITIPRNYLINVQALTSSPADGATVYFGTLPKAPNTSANISKVYVRDAATITGAEIYCYSGTAGTNEAWSLYIRVNNTTDYLIATVSANTSERVFSKTNFSISLNANDYFEIKGVQPTWATNPLTTIYGGYIKLSY